ncbi:MAG: glycosyltransferase family 4 protein, partial [Bacteroidota bacterium]
MKKKKQALKILYVVKSLPDSFKGGIQTHIWELTRCMMEMGHEVTILSAGSMRKGPERYKEEGREIIKIPYLPGRRMPFLKMTLEELNFNVAARNWIRHNGEDYDIIHLQGRSGTLISRQMMRKVPTVVTFHGLITVETRHFHGMKRWTLDRRLHQWMATRFEKRPLKDFAGIICVSQEMRKSLELVHKVDPHKTQIIYNGIDTNIAMANGELDPNLLVYVGRIDWRKGVFTLLDAMKNLHEKIKLVVIGDGPAMPEIRAEVQNAGLGQRVNLLGSQNHSEIYSWLRKAYALVLPSFYETQGIVLMEANVLGRPVIGCNVPGVNEVVIDGHNGLLVPPGKADNNMLLLLLSSYLVILSSLVVWRKQASIPRPPGVYG